VERFRRHRELDLETGLRAARPVPSDELVRSILARTEERSRASRRGFRLAFAGVLTAVMLAALGSYGGLGYATAGVTGAAKAAKRAVASKEQRAVVKSSPAQSQYGKKCGHSPATDVPPRNHGSTKPAPGTPPGNPDNDTCPGTSGPKG
jgi:hypothetical protein